jgi:uncharacterized membrane protein
MSTAYPIKEKIVNFLSVVWGVSFYVLVLFFVIPVIADSLQKSVSQKTYYLVMIIITFLVGMVAGVFSYVTSTRKGLIHAAIVGIVIFSISLYAQVAFRLKENGNFFFVLLQVVLLTSPFLGGLLIHLIKRK